MVMSPKLELSKMTYDSCISSIIIPNNLSIIFNSNNTFSKLYFCRTYNSTERTGIQIQSDARVSLFLA